MKPIYLEPDEEITSVIDKLSAVSDHAVAVVVPKNSSLFQSLINLKLLAKEGEKQSKKIALITTNKVGQRLAAQVGLQTYNTVGALGNVPTAEPRAPHKAPVVETEEVDGVRVNRYQPAVADGAEASEPIEETDLPTVAAEPADLAVIAAEPEEALVAAEPASKKLPEKANSEADSEIITVESEKKVAERPAVAISADTQPEASLPAVVSRGYKMAREPFTMPWRSLIVALVLLIISCGLIYVFLPRATVTLTFPAQSDNQTLTLTAQTGATPSDLTVAGTTISAQKQVTQTFAATGKKDIGTKATGSVTISNTASSSPITLAAGTIFTANSQQFTLDKAVTVAGAVVSNGNAVAGKGTGTITAVSAGDSGNINNANFTIAGQSKYVTATGSTTGGVSKQVTVLAQADIDSAITALKAQANTQALADLQAKLSGQTLLDNSTWQAAPSQTVSNAVGDQVAQATATYTVEYSAIVFNSSDAQTALTNYLSKNLTSSQQLVIQNPASDITYTYKAVSADKTAITFAASVRAYIITKVDQTAIAKSMTNKSIEQAKSVVENNYGATDVSVSISPSWWIQRLPVLSKAITIQYSFNQSQ